MTSPSPKHPHHVENPDALNDALEAEDEARASRGEPADDNYLTWLASRQLDKQTLPELAAEQEIVLDFRAVGPREDAVPTKAPVRHVVDISKSIRAVDLLRLDLPPLRWIVPDLIPEGTTILAAEPKIGKSSLVYQMCVEMACGGTLLGRTVAQGSVLYLALEDGPRRGQAKVRTALQGREMPDRMDVWWNARSIGEGLEEDLAEWLAEHPDARLVAIDTLERVRPGSDSRASAYRVDVMHLSALQAAFRNTDVGLVVVHHSRKEKGDDFVQAVSGTYGLTGSADTIVSIARTRNDSYAIMRATGREVPEIEMPVALDKQGLWHYALEALAATSDERLEVFEVIRDRGPLWALDIARALGKTTESGRVAVQQKITALVATGIIARGKKGYAVRRDLLPYIEEWQRSEKVQ